MVSVYKPTPAPSPVQQRDLDWLGGILDGEGSISRTGICISQKQSINPEVCAAISEALNRLEIDFAMARTHATDRFNLLGGRSLLIRLRQHARMVKMRRIVQTLFAGMHISETTGRGGGGKYPTVATMESIGQRVVYDIQTSTSNFVCDGFAVHNCQQMNDPQGGHVARFEERNFNAAQIVPVRIPSDGETYICWRPRYGGDKHMSRYSEGAAARVVDGRVYVIDAWQGQYTASGEAEKIAGQVKLHAADGVMIIAVPGCEYLWTHLRNEFLKRNISCKMQWIDFEEDDSIRAAAIEQLEPMIKSGRVLFSTAITKAAECRKQFVFFGLVEQNGIAHCVSKFAQMVPLSLMRANMAEEELIHLRRRRDDALLSQFLAQQGHNQADEQLRQKMAASLEAMAKLSNRRGPPLPGGLDG
jgi:hypothetical protein